MPFCIWLIISRQGKGAGVFSVPNLGYNGKCDLYNLRAIHPA